MTHPLFFHKLVAPTCREVVFAHFQNPHAAKLTGLSCTAEDASEPTVRYEWNRTEISTVPRPGRQATVRVNVPFGRSMAGFSRLIAALSVTSGARLSVLAAVKGEQVLLASEIAGKDKRFEIDVDLTPLLESAAGPDAFQLALTAKDNAPLTMVLHWLGLAAEQPVSASDLLRRSDLDYFFDGTPDLTRPRFAKRLVFDEQALDAVRAKLQVPVWAKHFGYMDDFAQACLQRDPIADVGPYLPGYDERLIRESERGRPPYYWEALMLGFVGLVKRDLMMIRHAQRYILCMLDTPGWFSSAEEMIPTSSWDARSFLPEMTTTSLALLWDWLDFTFKPPLRAAIARSLWRKGMAPVQGDLLQFPYMRSMNQGAVFCRALVLGGLMLEGQWDTKRFVDEWHRQLNEITDRIVRKDGAYPEGPAYLCQFAHGVLPAMIAWSRARGTNWRRDVIAHFGRTLGYFEAMSQQMPGTFTPMGDSRIAGCGGDLLPLLASLMPRDRFASSIVGSALGSGAVFRASGTLRNSGGILALVYGAHDMEVCEKARRPALSVLKESQKIRSTRSLGRHEVSILFNGQNTALSHSHEDAGSIVVELDDKIIICDPGMIEYGSVGTGLLKQAEFHNILIPLNAESVTDSKQVAGLSSTRMTYRRRGREKSFRASACLDGVWPNVKSYTRTVVSSEPTDVTIVDSGKSETPRRFQVNFVTPFRAEAVGEAVVVDFGIGTATVSGRWAQEVTLIDGPKDFSGSQITRIVFTSAETRKFDFSTVISIKVAG